MKVKDLLEELNKCQKEYGKEFLDWDIYTEQLSAEEKKDKHYKRVKDAEDWEYFECFGFNTIMPKEKIFTININY
jgi:DNA phosphorothioation-dependent restriction protein DptG